MYVRILDDILKSVTELHDLMKTEHMHDVYLRFVYNDSVYQTTLNRPIFVLFRSFRGSVHENAEDDDLASNYFYSYHR